MSKEKKIRARGMGILNSFYIRQFEVNTKTSFSSPGRLGVIDRAGDCPYCPPSWGFERCTAVDNKFSKD